MADVPLTVLFGALSGLLAAAATYGALRSRFDSALERIKALEEARRHDEKEIAKLENRLGILEDRGSRADATGGFPARPLGPKPR